MHILDILAFCSIFLSYAAALFNKLQSNRRDYGMRNVRTRCSRRKAKDRRSPSPTFFYPDVNRHSILFPHASDVSIGAVLSKVTGGIEHLVAYFRRTLGRAERQYCVTRHELPFVVQNMEQFVSLSVSFLSVLRPLIVTTKGSPF